jgi:hypothetical protein
LKRTYRRRPDLLEQAELSPEEREYLAEVKSRQSPGRKD